MSDVLTVLTNPAMPGIVRVHHAGDEETLTALRSLNSPGTVPTAFKVEYAASVASWTKVFEQLQVAFAAQAVSPDFGFYMIHPAAVIAVIRLVEVEDFTDHFRDVYAENFELAGIPEGGDLEGMRRALAAR